MVSAAEASQLKVWDFFLSYAQEDEGWASWAAWVLEEAGYQTLIQAWDFVPGSHYMLRMEEGFQKAARTIAVVSNAYLSSVYGKHEWMTAFRADPEGFARKLVPIRIEDCARPGLLDGIVSIDLFALEGRAAAQEALLSGIRHALDGRGKPPDAPMFPLDHELRVITAGQRTSASGDDDVEASAAGTTAHGSDGEGNAVDKVDEVVRVVDLRDPDWATFERDPNWGPFGRTKRLLMIAETGALADQAAALDSLVSREGVVESMVVLLGTAPGGMAPVLPGRTVDVLWIGDPGGNRGSPGGSRRVSVDPGDDGGTRNVARLLRVLREPEIFSAVRTVVTAFPQHIAAPAMRLLTITMDAATVNQELARAALHLTTTQHAISSVARLGAASQLDGLLTGSATRNKAGLEDIIRPGGKVATLAQQARISLRQARELNDRLSQLPLGDRAQASYAGRVPAGALVWPALALTGTQLTGLAMTVRRAFLDVDGSAGIGPEQELEIARLGIALPPVPRAEPAVVWQALRDVVADALTARVPLPDISSWLRDFADRASSTGSARHADKVEDIVPVRLATGLGDPARLPRYLSLTVLATAFAGAFLAGLWPRPGLAATPVAALLTCLVLAGVHRRRPVPQPRFRPDPRDVTARQAVLLPTGGAVLGGAAGLAVGVSLGDIAGPVGIACLVAGLAVSFLAPVLLWRRAVRGWVRRLNLDAVTGAVLDLGTLLTGVALNEWVLADQRRDAAARARSIVDALEALADGLRQLAVSAEPRAVDSELGFEVYTWENSGAQATLRDLLDEDLRTLIATALAGPDGPRRAGTAARSKNAAQLLTTYVDGLRGEGLFAPPPFARPSGTLAQAARDAWRDTVGLEQQLHRADPQEPKLVQLTGQGDLRLLEDDPTRARLVTFAPRVANLEPGAGVIAVEAVDLAGVLRLVPLVVLPPGESSGHV